MKKILSIILSIAMLCSSALCVPFIASASDIPSSPENGIPLLVVSIDESDEAIAAAMESDKSHTYGTVDDMNKSEDHSVRCVGDVSITVPEGYVSEYGSSYVPEGAIKMKYIRGRGNSTWQKDEGKSPYKIEFEDAVDFFGMGESTDWALMANAYDSTKIKNRITFKLGELTGIPYCVQTVPVEVVMTGSKTGSKYLGLYYLSETVKIDQSRLNIPKLKKSVTDDESITGGYLLSVYTVWQNGDEPTSNFFKVDSGDTFITKTPEFESEELTEGQQKQRSYIQSYVRNVDNLIMKSDGIDEETHNEIADKLDLKSVADYWWIQEFSTNGDAFNTSSTYFYKDRGGKLCFGPLWDFDLAWSGVNDPDTNTTTGFNNTANGWVDKLRDEDEQFDALLKERWNDPENGMNAKLAEITKEGGFIDQYKAEIKSAWEKDIEIWPQSEFEAEYEEPLDFDKEIEELRSWIDSRRNWVNNNLNSVSDVFFKVDFTVDGKILATRKIRSGGYVYYAPDAPDKEGYVFTDWIDVKTGLPIGDKVLDEDSTAVAKYVKETNETLPKALYLSSDEEWEDIKNSDTFSAIAKAIPETAIKGKVTWTSSDESVAVYSEEDKEFQIKGVGDTIITATLRNGVSASLVLHIYDSDVTPTVKAAGMKASVEKSVLEPGEYTKIKQVMLPEGKPVEPYMAFYTTEDNDIVELDDSEGIVKALKPGKATITVIGIPDWDSDSPKYTKDIVITVAHTLDKGTVTKKPTYTATGKKVYKCTVCGQVVKTVKLAKLKKKANTLKAKGKTVKVKRSELSRKAQSIKHKKAITVKNAKGKVTYKKVKGNKKIVINKKTGKIKIKKGLKKGTYKIKIKVKAKGTSKYKAKTKTVTVTIKVK